jgi:hypothetical protein
MKLIIIFGGIFSYLTREYIMRRILESLRNFFLLLAGLAVTAHMIIPHDHHLSDQLSGQNIPCPVSDSETGHNKGFPVHCHAFNDLAAEKFPPTILQKNLQTGPVSVCRLYNIIPLEFHYSGIAVNISGIPFPQIFTASANPFRAPPRLS